MHARGGSDNFAARVCGAQTVSRAVEERKAQIILEKLDAGSEGGRGDVQDGGGFDDSAGAGDLVDGFQLLESEAWHGETINLIESK
jgi:hypothetical protein